MKSYTPEGHAANGAAEPGYNPFADSSASDSESSSSESEGGDSTSGATSFIAAKGDSSRDSNSTNVNRSVVVGGPGRNDTTEVTTSSASLGASGESFSARIPVTTSVPALSRRDTSDVDCENPGNEVASAKGLHLPGSNFVYQQNAIAPLKTKEGKCRPEVDLTSQIETSDHQNIGDSNGASAVTTSRSHPIEGIASGLSKLSLDPILSHPVAANDVPSITPRGNLIREPLEDSIMKKDGPSPTDLLNKKIYNPLFDSSSDSDSKGSFSSPEIGNLPLRSFTLSNSTPSVENGLVNRSVEDATSYSMQSTVCGSLEILDTLNKQNTPDVDVMKKLPISTGHANKEPEEMTRTENQFTERDSSKNEKQMSSEYSTAASRSAGEVRKSEPASTSSGSRFRSKYNLRNKGLPLKSSTNDETATGGNSNFLVEKAGSQSSALPASSSATAGGIPPADVSSDRSQPKKSRPTTNKCPAGTEYFKEIRSSDDLPNNSPMPASAARVESGLRSNHDTAHDGVKAQTEPTARPNEGHSQARAEPISKFRARLQAKRQSEGIHSVAVVRQTSRDTPHNSSLNLTAAVEAGKSDKQMIAPHYQPQEAEPKSLQLPPTSSTVESRHSRSHEQHPSKPYSPPKPKPTEAIPIFHEIAARRLENLKLADFESLTVPVFLAYCTGFFEGKTDLPSDLIVGEDKLAGDALTFLHNSTSRLEQLFAQFICMPAREFVENLAPLRSVPNSSVPSAYKDVVQRVSISFAAAYEERNAEICRLEDEVVKVMIAAAGDYVEKECAYLAGDFYLEPEPFEEMLKPVIADARQNFLAACEFKSDFFVRKYSAALDEEIKRQTNSSKRRNEQRKSKVEMEISKAVEDAVDEYKKESLRRNTNFKGPKSQHLNQLKLSHNNVFSNLKTKFDGEFSRKWPSCPKMFESARVKLEGSITSIYEQQRASLSKVEAPAKPATTTGSSDTSTKGSKQSDRSQPTNSDMKLRSQSANRDTPKPKESGIAFKELSSGALAIHFGLRRTKIGTLEPGTKTLKLLADVDNCVYYRDGRIAVALTEDESKSFGDPTIDFRGKLIEGPIDQKTAVRVDGAYHELRKENIISFILAALKWRAELRLQRRFPKCVVVVPQFLNELQRTCVLNGAMIAGFEGVAMLNDTNAVALAYMIDSQVRQENVIVGVLLEDTIDVATFRLNYGMLNCLNVSGWHCINYEKKPKGWVSSGWEWLRRKRNTLDWDVIIPKIFSTEELKMHESRLQDDWKLLVGDPSMIGRVRSHFNGGKNILTVEDLSILKGGCYLSALFSRNPMDEVTKTWSSLKSPAKFGCSFEDFKKNLLSNKKIQAKYTEKVTSGENLSVEAFSREKTAGILQKWKKLHQVKMDAFKILAAIRGTNSWLKESSESDQTALTIQLTAFEENLCEPTITMEEAEGIKNELENIWKHNVGGK